MQAHSLRRAMLRAIILLALLLSNQPMVAQEAPVAAVPGAQQQVSVAQLEELRTRFEQGRERIATLTAPLDTTAANAWLQDSPLERLRERAADENLPEAERTVWADAVAYEQAGVERVRGGLNRADLALSSLERLDVTREQVEAMLASLAARQTSGDPDERTISQIDQEMSTLQSLRTQVALELTQSQQILEQLEEQQRTQAETLTLLQRERDALIETPPATEAGEAGAAANEALTRRSEANLVTAQLDAQTIPPRIERLRLQVQAKELEHIWLGNRLEALRNDYNQRSTEELRAFNSDLQSFIEREPDVSERFAEELTVIRQRIDQIGQIQERIRTLQVEREEAQLLEAELQQTLTNVRERLANSGLTDAQGSLFLDEQRRLRTHDDKRFALRRVDQELSQSRLRNISLREQLFGTPAQDTRAEDPTLQELARLQQQTLSSLIQADDSLTGQLRQTGVALRSVVAVHAELDKVLSETLIWWPSHVPVGLSWLLKVPPALLALLEPRSWQEIYTGFLSVTVGNPTATLLTFLLVGLLYRLGKRTREHLARLAEKTRHRFTDNIKLTFKAMGWSTLRVLPGPALLAITSYRLQQASSTAPGVEVLATVLLSAAGWWLAGHLLLIFTSRNGVGTVHFEWPPSVVRRLRLNFAWYLPAQFLLILCMTLVFVHPNDLVFDVFGRIGLVASGAITGVMAWRLLAPDQDVPFPRRRIFRLLSIAFAGAVVTLSLAGYLLTARELLTRTIDTVVVLGLVWLGWRLATRALVLSEERLRVRRLREERAKAAAMESSAAAMGEGSTVDVPEQHLSLEDINQQTMALVKVTAGSMMVLALYWVWKDILPALTWLDGVTLWTRTITVADTEVLSDVSLQDALLALGLGVVLMMAVRNLPGLVEILLMRGTQMDASGRYTVATLLRYALIVFMVVTVFSLLGLRWSELQWMVAALTLGLGFGLQEVVANFVSGLIMLFERPVRVGDTITIGEFSGTVGRIRTRATTIIDWDNREIVVPNKNFITERLINWTLSDTMTRIVVPVAVHHDSDAELVIESLLEIAAEHSSVMEDPAPTCYLIQLAESTLNFELRVYVNQLRERLETMSSLHLRILQVFRERGIVIAYPQMDLHIVNMPQPIASTRNLRSPPELPALAD